MTPSMEQGLIKAARECALGGRLMPDEPVLSRRMDHSHRPQRMQQYDTLLAGLRGRLRIGRQLTRDEMNER